jgi:hypothetical protein
MIDEQRNVWISIAGVGWRRLPDSSNSAIVAFTILSACAKQIQTRVDFREGDNSILQELYVY